MKKIFLILILFTACNVFSQSMYLKKLRVIDSIYAPARINAGAYYLNGVPFSAGGGDVYLGNRQTFAARNVFSDTLKADGLSLIDNARITSNLNVTGDIISDLDFVKGSNVRIGTSDSYKLYLKTADTNRFYIDSLGFATFNKSLAVGTYMIATDSINTTQFSANSIFLNGYGGAIYFRGYNSSIVEGSNSLIYTSRTHDYMTKGGYNYIAHLDSATGMNLIYGDYYKNGVLLFDSSAFARTGTGLGTTISEVFNSIVTFASAVYFSAAATFNSTLTAAGDFIPTWTKNNSSRAAQQYEKIKIVSGKMPATVSTGSPTGDYAHGLNFNQIRSWTVMVKDDTTNYLYNPGQYYGTGILLYARVDSLNCKVETGSTAYSILNDSVFFRLVYTDFDR